MRFYNKVITPLHKSNLFRKRTILQLSDYILLRQILFDGRLINRHHKMFAEPLSLNDKNVKSSLINFIIAVKCQHLGTLDCIQFYFPYFDLKMKLFIVLVAFIATYCGKHISKKV